MKKLNKKGMTTVEILVSFIIVAMICISVYNTVNAFSRKRTVEDYRLEISTYKNLITKELQDDLIKKGLRNAIVRLVDYDKTTTTPAAVKGQVYVADLYLKDGNKKRIVVEKRIANDYANTTLSDIFTGSELTDEEKRPYGDEFVIYYGKPENDNPADDFNEIVNGLTKSELPDIGSGYNEVKGLPNNDAVFCKGGNDGCRVLDLRFNNVEMSTNNNVFSLFIGLYHPNFTSQYAINVVCPINYN